VESGAAAATGDLVNGLNQAFGEGSTRRFDCVLMLFTFAGQGRLEKG